MATHLDATVPKGNGWLPNGGKVSQDFGVLEYIPSLGLDQPHEGIDIAAPAGSPVTLPAGQTATVVKSFYDSKYGGGNTVQLALADGSLVDLFHLNDRAVAAGQAVNGGDLLGHVGTTGNSTGPHLHFQIMQGGSAVDPWRWLTEIGGAVSSAPTGGSINPLDALKNVNDFFGVLLEPRNWWKMAFVGIGGGMILMGVIVYFFQEEKGVVVQVESDAEKAGEVAAVA